MRECLTRLFQNSRHLCNYMDRFKNVLRLPGARLRNFGSPFLGWQTPSHGQTTLKRIYSIVDVRVPLEDVVLLWKKRRKI